MTQAFYIDQTLHGYRNGHRMLEGSIKLTRDADAQMQTLTDLLSPGMLRQEETYITGYPLRSMNRFAVARTWPALEIERPGAVWTHSLLLDYATLGNIIDPARLMSLFVKPRETTKFQYSEKIDYSGFSLNDLPSEMHDERSVSALCQLYGENHRNQIEIPSLSSSENEALVLSLWRQMWPALRRNIAFCTREGSELSSLEATTVLTFQSVGKSQTPAKEKRDGNIRPIQLLSKDLVSRSSTPLRNYIGRYAVDIVDAQKFVPRLVLCFEVRANPRKVAKLLEGSSSADDGGFQRLKRDTLLGATISNLPIDDLVETIRVFRHETLPITPEELSGLPFFLSSDSERAVPAIIEVVTDTSSGEFGDVVLQSIAVNTPVSLLARSAKQKEISTRLFVIRPEIAQEPEFWQISYREDLLSDCLQRGLTFEFAMEGLSSTLNVGDTRNLIEVHKDAARRGLSKFILSHQRDQPHVPLIAHLVNDKIILEDLASSELVSSPVLLELIATNILQDNSLELFHEIPELEESREKDRSELRKSPHFLTLALVKALEERTPSSIQRLNFVFDPLLDMINLSAFPRLCTTTLERNLGHRWNVRHRLLHTVIDFYRDANIIDPVILDVTRRKKSKEAIIDAIFDSVGAKRFREFVSRLDKLKPTDRQNMTLCIKRLERYRSIWPFS